ncbi:MAG: dihydropteroate synthase [Bacteroidia bacterium]|jgi:dihydropteroate synthase|nr:dihydropteroate synthase [Bacteroidia bacterium]
MDNIKIQTPFQKFTLNCNGRLLFIEQPQVMGIINTTPDSFFEGSRIQTNQLVDKAGEMLEQGAMFLDIGGYSSRPGADFVSESEELDRVLPAVTEIVKAFPQAIISVDTFRASIAKSAISAGASLINDISSGEADVEMLSTIASLKVPYIMMHKRGNPQTMMSLAQYTDVTSEVIFYFQEKLKLIHQYQIKDVIIDPGFGFAKLINHNYELMKNLASFNLLEKPILVGVSRKKMVQMITGTNAANALNGTTVLHTFALLKGASILRVHDVKEAKECINIVKALHGDI